MIGTKAVLGTVGAVALGGSGVGLGLCLIPKQGKIVYDLYKRIVPSFNGGKESERESKKVTETDNVWSVTGFGVIALGLRFTGMEVHDRAASYVNRNGSIPGKPIQERIIALAGQVLKGQEFCMRGGNFRLENALTFALLVSHCVGVGLWGWDQITE